VLEAIGMLELNKKVATRKPGLIVLIPDLPNLDLSHLAEELTVEGPIAASIVGVIQSMMPSPEEAQG